MKRLFRTSKSPIVDPLPPPPLSAPSSGTSTPTHHHHNEHRWPFGHNHQSEVTPFPMDAGRETAGPGSQTHQPPSGPQLQPQPQFPPPHQSKRKGKERVSSGGGGGSGQSAPSLLEIQQMQEREQAMRSGLPSRQPTNQQPQHQQRPSRGGSYGSQPPSPDGWTVVSPQRNTAPLSNNGFDPPYHSPSAQPLPIPHAAFANPTPPSSAPSPSSASTHTALYLPPGARPATPPSTRPPYATAPGSARHSQSSLGSVSTAQYGGPPSGKGGDDMLNMAPQVGGSGRERGHSVASYTGSASARSDHESSLSGSHVHTPFLNNNGNVVNVNNNPASPSKLQKPSQQPVSTRSPLANSYNTHQGLTSFPAPHPYSQTVSVPTPPEPLPNPFGQSQDDMTPPSSQPQPPAQAQTNQSNLFRRGSQADGGKDKKRGFWGRGWTKGKERQNDKDKEKREGLPGMEEWPRQSVDESRRSAEIWRDSESQPSSIHGHSTNQGHEQDEAPRGRLLGLDFSGVKKEREPQPHQVNDVTSAIHMLCTMPDPPPANILEVCDRINQSSDNDSVAKEAARALRKEFKHGNEGERRNAAKVWLILMRNVKVRGFRQNATSKKFFTSFEPILLAPTTKPLVSAQTHRLLTDILADLTFAYGMEKGCEGLVDMWKKVKLPQEPDFGNPLPVDHPIFNNEPAYGYRARPQPTPPQSVSNSRRPSSPSLQHLPLNQNQGFPPPLPQRGPSPGNFGPGYANLPNHGEDIRRLVEECTAAKESARVLTEAMVYTRPEELEHKPIIGEFYRKVFLAHESLTNQMDWAQAEAARSRERHASLTLDGTGSANSGSDHAHQDTPEEKALATLFEAHSALSEALRQHDETERIAAEEKEMREVRERSKKETRMDRNQIYYHFGGLAPPGGQPQASSSRSPSPVPHARLPAEPVPRITSSPRNYEVPLPPPAGGHANRVDGNNHPFKGAYTDSVSRSRTPSPDRHPLPPPPKIPASPSRTRTSSPLGRARMGGPRPLPNPFAKNASQNSLAASASANVSAVGTPAPGTGTATPSNGPSRSGTDDTPSRSGTGDSGPAGSASAELEEDGDNLPAAPVKPSRKALGKRRAVVDEDNNFDPNDMFAPNPSVDPRTRPNANGPGDKAESDTHSDESITALTDALRSTRPVVYAYDAYEERQKELKRAEEALKISGGSGGGSRSGGSGA